MGFNDLIEEINNEETDTYIDDLIKSISGLITGETKIGVGKCDACQCNWVALYCGRNAAPIQCPECYRIKGGIVEEYVVTKLNS